MYSRRISAKTAIFGRDLSSGRVKRSLRVNMWIWTMSKRRDARRSRMRARQSKRNLVVIILADTSNCRHDNNSLPVLLDALNLVVVPIQDGVLDDAMTSKKIITSARSLCPRRVCHPCSIQRTNGQSFSNPRPKRRSGCTPNLSLRR